jgi:hypothetical protein
LDKESWPISSADTLADGLGKHSARSGVKDETKEKG